MVGALANNAPSAVCLGKRRYVVRRNFLQFRPGQQLGFVSQLAVDSKDRLFLLNRGDPVVQIFSPDGALLEQWYGKEFTHGHGIFIAADDRVLIVDSDRHSVLIYSNDGQLLRLLGMRDRPSSGAPFNHPTDVAVAPTGDIYVSDGYGNSVVHRFSADGELLKTWGGPGQDIGQFSNPHAIWIDRDGQVLVADRENHRVQVFDLNGIYRSCILGLYLPTDICGGENGFIYVSDQTPRLSAYTVDGRLIGRCRTFGGIGHGIACDRRGTIYVADMMPSNVTRFDPVPDID